MNRVQIYHNPKCSKSRAALEILNEKCLDPEVIHYLNTGLSVPEVINLASLLGVKVLELLRTKEAEFKSISIDWSDDHLAAAQLVQFPKLLERPIVINIDKAVIARPPEKLLEII